MHKGWTLRPWANDGQRPWPPMTQSYPLVTSSNPLVPSSNEKKGKLTHMLISMWFSTARHALWVVTGKKLASAARTQPTKTPGDQPITAGWQIQHGVGSWKPQRHSIDIPQRRTSGVLISVGHLTSQIWEHDMLDFLNPVPYGYGNDFSSFTGLLLSCLV